MMTNDDINEVVCSIKSNYFNVIFYVTFQKVLLDIWDPEPVTQYIFIERFPQSWLSFQSIRNVRELRLSVT